MSHSVAFSGLNVELCGALPRGRKDYEMRPKKPRARRSKTGGPGTGTPELPVVSSEAVLEQRSRTIFEEAVSPWLVTPWNSHDYGMDAMVEILVARGSAPGYLNTGRRIGVQLKATNSKDDGDASVVVKRRTLRYWTHAIEPFCLVVCHVPTRTLAYRWIDDGLHSDLEARDPLWFTRETVTVRVPWSAALTFERLEALATEARMVTVRRHRLLSPGTYDRLLKTSRETMAALVGVAKEAHFESVVARLRQAAADVERATYVVAVAGRMRAGKSTLFNALLRREVSPVGRRPTTAVAIFAEAGAADEGTVVLEDGSHVAINADARTLAEYATQDANPDNEKGVRLITLRLVDARLERGIAIVDAPGLFDPSEEIRAITARALARANAVLFVMDVSSARNGGFAVEAPVLDELKRVLDHSERVFLLLNKADELKAPDRDDVLGTLQQALRRHGLEQRFAGPARFISAEQAWQWVLGGSTDGGSPLAELESELWQYLLKTSSTGVMRLETAVRASKTSVAESLAFLAARRSETSTARRLRERLDGARERVRALRSRCAAVAAEDGERTSTTLNARLHAIPTTLASEMRKARAISPKEVVNKRLHDLLATAFLETWEAARFALELHADEINDDLEDALQQVRLEAQPAAPANFMAPRFELPATNTVGADALGWGAVGAVVGSIFAPALAVMAGIASFLASAWFGRERQLAREIARIEAKLRVLIVRDLAVPTGSFLDAIQANYRRLDRLVADRWAVFEKDMTRQLAAAGTPLSSFESRRLARLEAELTLAQTTLDAVAEEIRWTPAPAGSSDARGARSVPPPTL